MGSRAQHPLRARWAVAVGVARARDDGALVDLDVAIVPQLRLRAILEPLRRRVHRARVHMIAGRLLGARIPRDREVDAKLGVRAVVAALLEQQLNLVRVGALQRHHQHVLEGLHRRDLEALRPSLVVKVVGGEEVVGSVDGGEDVGRLLLAVHVLVGVPLERHLAEAHLHLVQVAAILLLHSED